MKIKFLRQLVKRFGFLAKSLPKDYWPATEAFLFSLTNETPDCERPVPQEILPTLTYAVLHAIGLPNFYERAKLTLNTHAEPVLVRQWDYPKYQGPKIPGYESHPHYFVLGGFTAYPQGSGLWLIQDRYDWHVPDYWRVPDIISDRVPEWVLSKFCEVRSGGYYLKEVGTLDRWTVPYWHRSVVKLSDYLDPKWFE